MATAQSTDNVITLRGSTDIVTEFFTFSINSILYQRGIYPPESFARRQKYGITMLVSQDEAVTSYLEHITRQLESWLLHGKVQRLVVVVTGIDSGETLERWVFNVQNVRPVLQDSSNTNNGSAAGQQSEGAGAALPPARKTAKEIHDEIQAIIRQITASVTFLPLLDEACSFDVLIYADKDASVPLQWEDSDPRYIRDSSEVRLRGFNTKVHQVDAMVAFKNPADEVV